MMLCAGHWRDQSSDVGIGGGLSSAATWVGIFRGVALAQGGEVDGAAVMRSYVSCGARRGVPLPA